jgi:ribosomal protein S18 acetylase RimI-like enzyme
MFGRGAGFASRAPIEPTGYDASTAKRAADARMGRLRGVDAKRSVDVALARLASGRRSPPLLARGRRSHMESSNLPSYTVRDARPDDAPAIARLLTALGHPTTSVSITDRWERWSNGDNGALVATADDGKTLGVVTIHRMEVLHRPRPVGRITALIVDEFARGLGIGKALVRHVEERFAAEGCGLLEVTSHSRLVDAHRFYEQVGYERTSMRFARALA